jgi:thiamine pyrophosphokinase
MTILNVHPLKELLHLIHDRSRFFIIGPQDIDPQYMKKIKKKERPDFFIFVDGGLQHKKLFTKKQLKSSCSVGDGDSSQKLVHGPLDILLPVQKDYSDLAFVLRALLKSKSKITCLGLFGFSSHYNEKRLDHLIFNLGEIENITSRLKIQINLDGHFLFLPAGANSILIKGPFSLITFRPNKLKITGRCDFELAHWTKLLPLSSKGLSNRGTGVIKIKCQKSMLLYFVDSKLST